MSDHEYKIEKNVPYIAACGKFSRFPLKQMEVGDSFVFDEKDSGSIRSACSWFGKRYNMKFSVRAKVRRCWRVK